MSLLNWREKTEHDDSIQKINIYEYEPHHGTNLNSNGGDIRLTISNEDQFILPSESHLYFEGSLVKNDNTPYAADEVGISLVNNGLMYLFNRMEYSVANQSVEGFNNPGVATTMKGLLTYPRVYPEGENFFWTLDENIEPENNEGYSTRCKYIHSEGNGKFSALVPLKHVFGFCEHHKKIMYGAKHEITLHRNGDDDATLRLRQRVVLMIRLNLERLHFQRLAGECQL